MQIISRKEAKKLALKHYFPNTKCPKGHISKRWTSNAACMQCHEESFARLTRPTKEQQKQAAKTRAKKWYLQNKELTILRAKEWKSENKDAVSESFKKWKKKDTSKSIMFMRQTIRRCLVSKNGKRTHELLGYSKEQLAKHIEKQFLKGMNWENRSEWHIDHIIPLSVMLKNGETDPKVINALTNLKPIWKKENLSKGIKMEYLL